MSPPLYIIVFYNRACFFLLICCFNRFNLTISLSTLLLHLRSIPPWNYFRLRKGRIERSKMLSFEIVVLLCDHRSFINLGVAPENSLVPRTMNFFRTCFAKKKRYSRVSLTYYYIYCAVKYINFR